MAGSRGVLHIKRQVPGIPLPLVELGIAAVEAAFGYHRLGQGVDAHCPILAVEVVAEHHRAGFQARGEAGVEVQARAQRRVCPLELVRVLELGLRQAIEHVDARAWITLGPDHIEGQELHPLALEQPLDQLGHHVAAPGPAADLAQALLVDVEEDDAVVSRARHGHRQARVVHDVVELRDERDALGAQRVCYEEEDDRKAEDDPREVRSQDLRKNSILVPASSITSWSLSECGAAPISWPLTVGRFVPSTCVMK